jgi:hypothetical protein
MITDRRKEARAAGDWLRDTPPAAVVGHSLYVYDRRIGSE